MYKPRRVANWFLIRGRLLVGIQIRSDIFVRSQVEYGRHNPCVNIHTNLFQRIMEGITKNIPTRYEQYETRTKFISLYNLFLPIYPKLDIEVQEVMEIK